ncbi:type II secretion system F family protein [Conexibacter sp. SYSU D00693]|uniref:type II secretion system F family protein n=1 Tax=Conexibacter sp. SYSU D00693 TaxID=2812560 RepID=UPI00196A7E84|nr:type II secretion system F family protein [Conexibacter sp. SYSU D00693]
MTVTPAVMLAVAAAWCAAAGVVELAEHLAAERAPAHRAASRRPLTALLLRLGRALGVPRAPADLRARLHAAGLEPRRAADVMATKGGAAAAGLLLGLALLPAAPGRTGLLVLVALPAGAFALPDLVLRRRTRRRAQRLALELPDVLDLLRVALDAGLPTTRALGEVGARRAGLLAAELGATAARIELGEPRAAAFERLALRAPLPEVAALVAVLLRADRHGAPPAAALEALAVDARAQRARRIRDDAARAAPKIQLVVALLLVPAVLLLVAASLVHSLL